MLINKTHEESEEPHPSKKKLKSNLKTFCLEQKKILENDEVCFSLTNKKKQSREWLTPAFWQNLCKLI